jgi:hypothetical protein
MSLPTDNYRCKQHYDEYRNARRDLEDSILNQDVSIQNASFSHSVSSPTNGNFLHTSTNLFAIKNWNTQIQSNERRLQAATQAVFQCLGVQPK